MSVLKESENIYGFVTLKQKRLLLLQTNISVFVRLRKESFKLAIFWNQKPPW